MCLSFTLKVILTSILCHHRSQRNTIYFQCINHCHAFCFNRLGILCDSSCVRMSQKQGIQNIKNVKTVLLNHNPQRPCTGWLWHSNYHTVLCLWWLKPFKCSLFIKLDLSEITAYQGIGLMYKLLSGKCQRAFR